MAGLAVQGHTVSLARFVFYRLLPAIILLIAGVIVLIVGYITSPRAAAKLSTILSIKLDLPVTIAAIHLHGDTLSFQGITISNPAGFDEKNIASIERISVAPGWTGLLQGRRTLRKLDVAGVRLNLRKKSNGDWNIEQLRKQFSGGKGGAELFINDLLISNSDVLVNGRGLRGISLRLGNVATKGSAGSTANLSFDDPSGNRYSVTGSFRGGAAPEAEFSLEAPSLALAGLTAGNKQLAFPAGKGNLRLTAALHDGVVRSAISATVSDGTVTIRDGAAIPLSGKLQGNVTYNLHQDRLTLDTMTLDLDKILKMSASGSATGLKNGLQYDLALGIQQFDLARIAALLPVLQMNEMKATGTVTARKLRITGSAQDGVASIAGVISLRDLLLERNSRLLINGIGTDMHIATVSNSIQLAGELTQKQAGGTPLLENIRSPYAVILSRALQPQSVVLPGFAARVLGAPFRGNFTFRSADKVPIFLSLLMPTHQFKERAYGDFSVADGAAALSVELTGASTTTFSGSASLSFSDLKGNSKGEPFALGSSILKTAFKAVSGRYSASGNVTFNRAVFKEMAADGNFAFSSADNVLQFENGTVKVADTTFSFARLVAALPLNTALSSTKGYPVAVKLAGGAVSHGELVVSGLVATLNGNYIGTKEANKFTGAVEIAAEKFLWRGRNFAAPQAAIAISGDGATITLAGTVLGGTVGGMLTGNPYAVADGVDFELSLHEVELEQLPAIIEKNAALTLTGGKLTLASKGRYIRKTGVTCRLKGEADKITVAGKGGRELLGRAGMKFDAVLAQGDINLTDAFLRIGEGVTLQMKGAVSRAFSPQRDGTIAFSLSRTPLNRLVDPIVNGMPLLLQEATLAGDIAVKGALGLHNGRTTLQGFVHLDGIGIDAESKKVSLTGVSGNIPFSHAFPLNRHPSPEQTAVLKRELYDQQLALFTRTPTNGSVLKINRIAFGPLEFADTELRIRAGEGIIEALSISSSLAGGKIIGQSYVAFTGDGSYGGDLLLNNLSLEHLCTLFPSIKGYVSGRVDGLAMFEGEGANIRGLNGYTSIWTHSGDGEKMLISREFLQKLAGKKLQGFFFRNDRPYDTGEVMASLQSGYLTFDILDIAHTNLFGVRDLKVSVAETQNSIALEHLLDSISQAVSRGKGTKVKGSIRETTPPPSFKWDE